jgi:hypothetical protein
MPLTVSTGHSASLNVQFAPTASGSVAFTDNGPNSPQALTLSGHNTTHVIFAVPGAGRLPCPSLVLEASSLGPAAVGDYRYYEYHYSEQFSLRAPFFHTLCSWYHICFVSDSIPGRLRRHHLSW